MFKIAFKNFTNDLKKYKREIIIGSIVYILLILIFGKTCVLRMLFGVPCAFCGFTRAFIKVLCFNFVDALKIQPFVFLVLALFIIFVLKRYFNIKINDKVFYSLITVCLVGVIAFYIYRMVYFFPTNEPMVYDDNNLLKTIINLYFGGTLNG